MFWLGTMHTGWVKNKTNQTSTFKQMINGVVSGIGCLEARSSTDKSLNKGGRREGEARRFCGCYQWMFPKYFLPSNTLAAEAEEQRAMMARETAARMKLFMVLVSGICDALHPTHWPYLCCRNALRGV